MGTALDLLQVAREHGLAGLTLRDVATRIGMRAPSLYTHFASKMAIIDAMFGQAWSEYLEVLTEAEKSRPTAPRAALAWASRTFFDFAVADLERYQLMNKAVVPGFTPSASAYAPSVEVLRRLEGLLVELGVDDEIGRDLFTGVISGMIDQQLANDPGGTRWQRLLNRAVDMYADHMGLPGPPLQDRQ